MTTAWTAQQLQALDRAVELEVAPPRHDGTVRWTPVWVVVADGEVYVRTWYRRSTGWYGRALRAGRTAARVPGHEVDVSVADVGDADPRLRTTVDAAYVAKYGAAGADRMVGDEAAATTLRLRPA